MSVYDELDGLLKRSIKKHQVPGASIAILRGNRITKTASAGVINLDTGVPVNDESVFQIGSVTKPMTATLIMQLVDEGKVDLDTPVRHYLKDFRVARYDVSRNVTVRHLLSHSSGIDGDFFEDAGRGDDAGARLLKMATMLPSLFDPGQMMSYCNIGYVALGRIIEVVTGQSYDRVIRKRLFAPLGMERALTRPEDTLRYRSAIGHIPDPSRSGEWRVTPVPYLSLGQTAAGATPSMTATDLLRFAQMHMQGGVSRSGEKILSKSAVRSMQQRQIKVSRHLGRSVDYWGLGWLLCNWDGVRLYGHDGAAIGQFAYLRVLPEKNIAIAMLTNGGYAADVYNEVFGFLFSGLARAQEPALPEVVQTSSRLDRYAGRFENMGAELIFEQRQGELTVTQILKSGEEAPIKPKTPVKFVDRDAVRLATGNPRMDWITYVFSQPADNKMQFVGTGFRQLRRVAGS